MDKKALRKGLGDYYWLGWGEWVGVWVERPLYVVCGPRSTNVIIQLPYVNSKCDVNVWLWTAIVVYFVTFSRDS